MSKRSRVPLGGTMKCVATYKPFDLEAEDKRLKECILKALGIPEEMPRCGSGLSELVTPKLAIDNIAVSDDQHGEEWREQGSKPMSYCGVPVIMNKAVPSGEIWIMNGDEKHVFKVDGGKETSDE